MSTLVEREMRNCEFASETVTFYSGAGGGTADSFFEDVVFDDYWYNDIPIIDKMLSHWIFDFTPQIVSISVWMIIIAALFGTASLNIFNILTPTIIMLIILIKFCDVHH